MEAIRNYLEVMFASLPGTPQVQKAKEELWQMMEDKYTELLGEGLGEDQAVSVVISEFGNLEELKQTLGLDRDLAPAADKRGQDLTLEEVQEYLKHRFWKGIFVGLGVLLIILMPVPPILASGGGSGFFFLGPAGFFLLLAAGVGCMMYGGSVKRGGAFLHKTGTNLEGPAMEYVKEQREEMQTVLTLCRIAGVVLCIISVVPGAGGLGGVWSASLLFLFVGTGVFLLISTGIWEGGYKKLLRCRETPRRSNTASPRGMAAPKGDLHWEAYDLETKPLKERGGRRKRRRLIFAFLILFCVILGSLLPISRWLGGRKHGEFVKKEERLEEFTELYIDAQAMALEVIGEGGEFSYCFEGYEDLVPQLERKGEALHISQHSLDAGNRWGRQGQKLVLHVPENTRLKVVAINAEMGNVTLRQIHTEEFRGDLAMGNLSLRDLKSQSMVLDCGMGNMEGENVDFDTLEGNLAMGSVKMAILQPLTGYTMDLEAQMGAVLLNGEKTTGTYHRAGDEDKSIRLSCAMGTLRLNSP